jgi:pimeloyl-ACP methyl ester carboxylesterase
VHIENDWIFHYLLYNDAAVTPFDRSVYVAAYDSKDGIRAGYAWYQAFGQDIEDDKNYRPVQMPMLGIGGPAYKRLQTYLSVKATKLTMLKADGSGHFIPEEKPAETAAQIIDFLQ